MKRFTKLAVLAVSILGLVATAAPPAHADTVFGGAFLGTATVASGLDYPCAEFLSTTGGGTLPCPPTVPGVATLGLNGGTVGQIPNAHLTFGGHNSQAVSIQSSTCVGVAVNTPDKPKSTVETGCSFTSTSGFVEGYCGLSGGQVSGVLTSGGNEATFAVHFTGVGGLLLVSGHYSLGGSNHGLLVGVTLAVPPTPPIITPQSCLNKTARTFTIVGVVLGIPELVL